MLRCHNGCRPGILLQDRGGVFKGSEVRVALACRSRLLETAAPAGVEGPAKNFVAVCQEGR